MGAVARNRDDRRPGVRAWLALVLLPALVAGCSSTSDDAAPGTTKPSAASTTIATSTTVTYQRFADVDSTTDPFLVGLAGDPALEVIGAQETYELGVGMCRSLDDGVTIESLLEATAELHPELGEASTSVLVAAAGHLCPTHQDAVQSWVKANGG